jgi:hypothetical protein
MLAPASVKLESLKPKDITGYHLAGYHSFAFISALAAC